MDHPLTETGLDSNPASDLGLARLVRSAAHAAGCPIGLFLTSESTGFTIGAAFGIGSVGNLSIDSAFLASVAASDGDSASTIIDLLEQSESSVSCSEMFGSGLPLLRFVIAVRVAVGHDEQRGLLIVADTAARPGLSVAGRYVLLTHAAQITALLELVMLRHEPALEQVSASLEQGRFRAMERLRLLESVVVNANDAVLITEAEPIDLPGPRIVYCNAAFTRTTGYTEKDVIGRTPRILQGPATDRAALDRLHLALARWEPIEIELYNQRKNGTGFWVELSIAPVANEEGWYTHWVSVQRDVSDRKRAEEGFVRARIAEAENMVLEEEIKERRNIEAQLSFAAFHDDLTGLSNRAFFMGVLATALDRIASSSSFRIALLFLDLDRFKLVNDSMGHRAGDLLLMEVANRLRGCIRPQDTLARIGGDEFAVLVETTADPLDAIAITERISLAMRLPIWLGLQEIFPSCSVGVVQVTTDYQSSEDLMRDADIAMYRAKRHEAGSYVVFMPSMRDDVVDALALQTDLRNAMARGEFLLRYQPICDAETGVVLGLEALVRWQHPQRGLVMPGNFITVAEETGLVREIGHWVLLNACLQMRTWQDRFPGTGLRLSVNASGIELRDQGFAAGVRAVLEQTGFDPHLLQIEITESVFLLQPEHVDTILSEIRSLGVRVALDDFGTGYSSLGYLDRYSLDAIKIDRSFVLRMMTRPSTMAIVDAIITLGRALDLDIVAEGVETQAQLQALQAAGCKFVQGYLFGTPMTEHEIELVLVRQTGSG